MEEPGPAVLRGIEEWRCLVSIPLTFLRGLLAGFCPYSETLSRCLVSVRFEPCDFGFSQVYRRSSALAHLVGVARASLFSPFL